LDTRLDDEPGRHDEQVHDRLRAGQIADPLQLSISRSRSDGLAGIRGGVMTITEFLDRFPQRTKSGQQWKVRCPAHDDRTASLGVGEGDKGIVLTCYAGCSTDNVVAALGLRMADLFPPSERPVSRGPITVAQIAAAKGLPAELLRSNGFRDEHGKIVITYRDVDGTETRAHIRTALRAKDGSHWAASDLPIVPYGLWRIEEFRAKRTLAICEGETDTLTLWQVGNPAIGVPGASMVKSTLRPELLQGFDHILVFRDNDAWAGEKFSKAAADVAVSAGVEKVRIIVPPGDCKDVNDWYMRNPGAFVGELQKKVAETPMYQASPIYTPTDQVTGSGNLADRAAIRPRMLKLTKASAIQIRPVKWLWTDRLALGTLGLLGGREGIGKSILAYTLAADVTRGRLAGECVAEPRGVIIAASEDARDYTIVPRLMAANADLARVSFVDVEMSDGVETALSLPRDLADLEQRCLDERAALVILDPLLSRLDSALDTHKDADVRRALEPLVTLAGRSATTVLGLIHVSKSASNDPLTTLMASRAFAAVARTVLFVMAEPENERGRLLGTPKNNLGRTDLPTLRFQIDGVKVAETAEGPIWTGKLAWAGESTQSIREALESTAILAGDRSATTDAAEWLADYLADGKKDWAVIKRDGGKAGHAKDTLRRAKDRLSVVSQTAGFPRRAFWSLPLDARPAGQPTNAPNAPTASTGENYERDIRLLASLDSLDAVDAVGAAPGIVASTEAPTTTEETPAPTPVSPASAKEWFVV
jgi:hypothetical protein